MELTPRLQRAEKEETVKVEEGGRAINAQNAIGECFTIQIISEKSSSVIGEALVDSVADSPHGSLHFLAFA